MKKLLFILIFTPILFYGCVKETTSSTELAYSFKATNMNASISSEAALSGAAVDAGTKGSINWSSAKVNIYNIALGAMAGGKPVSFESKSVYNVNPFKPDSLTGIVALSPGVYENIKFKLSLKESSENLPVLLNGFYIESSGTKIPLKIELNQTKIIDLTASRVEILPSKYKANVVLAMNNLVKGLTASDFGQTTRSTPNNSIVVSSTINRPLFEKLSARLADCLSINIIKQ